VKTKVVSAGSPTNNTKKKRVVPFAK